MKIKQPSLPIPVIGDSHCRAFAGNRMFMPFFVGQGKAHNFISEETEITVRAKLEKIISHLNFPDRIMLVFGEPDTRHYAGQGWYPWQAETPPDISGYEIKVRQSVERYERTVASLTSQTPFLPLVLNITPSQRWEQNQIVDFYNACLEEICLKRNWFFLSINSFVYDADHLVRADYLGDRIHLNQRIQPIVETLLKNAGILNDSGYDPAAKCSHEELMHAFSFDERFGCFRQNCQ